MFLGTYVYVTEYIIIFMGFWITTEKPVAQYKSTDWNT